MTKIQIHSSVSNLCYATLSEILKLQSVCECFFLELALADVVYKSVCVIDSLPCELLFNSFMFIRDELAPHVRDCVECYTRDWVVVDYRYRHLSSSVWLREKESLVQSVPPQEFEVDLENTIAYNGNTEENGFKVIVIIVLLLRHKTYA